MICPPATLSVSLHACPPSFCARSQVPLFLSLFLPSIILHSFLLFAPRLFLSLFRPLLFALVLPSCPALLYPFGSFRLIPYNEEGVSFLYSLLPSFVPTSIPIFVPPSFFPLFLHSCINLFGFFHPCSFLPSFFTRLFLSLFRPLFYPLFLPSFPTFLPFFPTPSFQ